MLRNSKQRRSLLGYSSIGISNSLLKIIKCFEYLKEKVDLNEEIGKGNLLRNQFTTKPVKSGAMEFQGDPSCIVNVW